MNLFFDSIIFLYLLASSILAVALLRDRKRPQTFESRYPRITLTAIMLLCCSAVLVFWGSFIEPRLITINRVSIDLPNFEPTKPIRVALISDIHVGTYKKSGWVRRISKRIAQEQPDLVLLAGDFIVSQAKDAQYLSAFSMLPDKFPTYAVLGDHDYHVNQGYKLDLALAQAVHSALTDAGMQVLKNEAIQIKLHDAAFTLIGLDDWLAKRAAFPPLGGGAPPPSGGPLVIFIHNPDFILDPQSKNADLILAGNTHGGQVRLPFIGPVGRLPSKLPRTFDKGLFTLSRHSERLPAQAGSEESRTPPKADAPRAQNVGSRIREGSFANAQDDNQFLFITSGISESGPRARLFNFPEIVVLALR